MKLSAAQRLFHPKNVFVMTIALIVGVIIVLVGVFDVWSMIQQKTLGAVWEKQQLEKQVALSAKELAVTKREDQYVKNQKLQNQIGNIENTFTEATGAYEDLLTLRELTKDTGTSDSEFADILTLLSRREYGPASTKISNLRLSIEKQKQKIAATFTIPSNVPQSNAAPGSGYSRQSVSSEAGTNMVDIIAADISATRVIVDTASNETCTKDCPVLSLADYAARSGAYAGVNGSYFCPSDYPSCAEKKNSFDTLLMNKNKVYFNSDNNKYSVVPAVIFGGSYVRFVGQSLEWGRDTGIDSMIANQPLLVAGGNVVFGGNDDPKMGSMGSRAFVANRGNTVYIGVVHNVSVAGMARVLKALGMENALNLDSGGSIALWSGSYKIGPGRNIPNAILFVKK
jgi:hypothetical protein